MLDVLRAGETAFDVFHYTMSDAGGLISNASVTVTVRGIDNDDVIGTSGNDTLVGTSVGVALKGGASDDRYIVVSASDVVIVFPAEGVDAVETGLAAYRLTANVENLRFTGNIDVVGAGNDRANLIIGNVGNDSLSGEAGDDKIQGGLGNDVINGGDGIDTAIYRDAPSAVTVNLGATGVQVTGGDGSDQLVSIENIVGSVFDDILAGNAAANLIEGGIGADRLDGGAGLDTAGYASAKVGVIVNLGLQTAQNTIGAGFDTLINFENLLGSDFADTLIGNWANNAIEGGLGNDLLDGGTSTDTAAYDRATAGVRVSLAQQGSPQDTVGAGIDTLINFENLLGSAFNDTLEGNSADNVLDGGAGVDTVSYAAATAGVAINLALGTAQWTFGSALDTLTNFENVIGSLFNDTIGGDAGNNVLDGGAGIDTVSYARATSGITVSLALQGSVQATLGDGNDTLHNFENLTGSPFNDVLAGDAGNNAIDGGLGFDTLSYAGASAGVAVSLGKITTPQATGGAGIDTIRGIEKIVGSSFNDQLTGSFYTDTLVGGAGADRLTGGGGADFFQFLTIGDFGAGATPDRITDFNRAEGDRIDLSGIDTDTILVGDQSFLFIGASAFSGVSGELRFALNAGVFFVSGDINGDRIADFTFEVAGRGLTTLQANDFLL